MFGKFWMIFVKLKLFQKLCFMNLKYFQSIAKGAKLYWHHNIKLSFWFLSFFLYFSLCFCPDITIKSYSSKVPLTDWLTLWPRVKVMFDKFRIISENDVWHIRPDDVRLPTGLWPLHSPWSNRLWLRLVFCGLNNFLYLNN